MTSSVPAPASESYQPTAEQLARARSQKKFNRWAVYVPIGIVTLLLLLFGGLLIWFAVVDNQWRGTVSAVADILLILTICPTLLLCLLLPGLAIAATAKSKQDDIKPLRALQLILWRIEHKLGGAQKGITNVAEKLTPMAANFHARFSQIETTVTTLVTRQEKDTNNDEPPTDR